MAVLVGELQWQRPPVWHTGQPSSASMLTMHSPVQVELSSGFLAAGVHSSVAANLAWKWSCINTRPCSPNIVDCWGVLCLKSHAEGCVL
jgi:hypothetical protein